MSTITNRSTADDAWTAHQIEKQVIRFDSPQLVSISEGARICPGFFDDECHDELDPNQKVCKAHERMEDEHYKQKALAQEREEEVLSRSQYHHLHAERMEELRAARNGQVLLVQAISAKEIG